MFCITNARCAICVEIVARKAGAHERAVCIDTLVLTSVGSHICALVYVCKQWSTHEWLHYLFI